jgi:chromosome segregation ATPase
MMSWHKTAAAILTTTFMVSLSTSSFATQAVLDKAHNAIATDTKQAVGSQNKINNLDDNYQSLLQEFRATNSEIDQLKLYNKQMSKIVSNQQVEITKINQQVRDIEFTEQGILPLMSQMLDALEQFNQLDLPFLAKEREVRLAKLRELMIRADITVSEKYRRVLEAFQIEVEYGRTLEAYREKADDNIVYDYLRIGRTALYRLTLSADSAWIWNKTTGDWQLIDSSLLRDVRKAQDVARQTAAPELLTLPLTSPVSAKGGN